MDEYDYFHHLIDCLKSEYSIKTRLKLSCLGDFGGPVSPNVAVGNFNATEKYETARGLLITILINNNDDPALIEAARDWEQTFVNYLHNVHNTHYRISFMAQRSIQDEIVRESSSGFY